MTKFQKRKFYKKVYVFFLFFISLTLISACSLEFEQEKINNKELTGNYGTGNELDSQSQISNTQIDNIRISKLNSYEEWGNFKSFWKELNSIDPARPGEAFGPYLGSITNEEAEAYFGQLSGVVVGLQSIPEDVLSPLEIDILDSICKGRIEYIAYGNMSMITRMMPAPGQVRKENTIQSLEDRIDILLALKDQGIMDGEELEEAFRNIEIDILEYVMLDNISDDMIDYNLSYDIIGTSLDEYLNSLDGLEEVYKEGVESLTGNSNTMIEEMFLNIRGDIVKLKEIYPEFNDIVRELLK